MVASLVASLLFYHLIAFAARSPFPSDAGAGRFSIRGGRGGGCFPIICPVVGVGSVIACRGRWSPSCASWPFYPIFLLAYRVFIFHMNDFCPSCVPAVCGELGKTALGW